MNESNIIDVSESDFNEKIIEASEKKLVIVDFWAPWCGPCKQLTPILEKVVSNSSDKVILTKVNIDENQQIAAQLRIQSIPTVFAFKNKQIVNAFQGVLSEADIIKFLEKALGEKLNVDNAEFYKSIELLINNNNFDEAKESLVKFIAEQPKDTRAISLYLECLIETVDEKEVEEFINSLEQNLKKDNEIKKIIKRINLIKNNKSGPSIEELIERLKNSPSDTSIIIELSDKYFAYKNYDDAFKILLENYPNNKEKIKKKILDFFEVLGQSNEKTILYRKKLSSIFFS